MRSEKEVEKSLKEIEDRYKEHQKHWNFRKALSEKMCAILLKPGMNEAERRKQALNAEYYAHCLYEGAKHFVEVSDYAADIATSIDVRLDVLLWVSGLPLWDECVRFFGYTGDPKPRRELPTTVPFTLQEDFLIQRVFQKYSCVRFVTYTGFIDTLVKKVARYDFLLDDGRKLSKHDVILAFPQDRMQNVKRGIKVRKTVADLGLKAIVRRSERPQIDVNALIGADIECVMRNGLVVSGENIWISKYNIVMRVGGKKGEGGKVILLYQHALHAFKVLKTPPVAESSFRDAFEFEDEVSETSQHP